MALLRSRMRAWVVVAVAVIGATAQDADARPSRRSHAIPRPSIVRPPVRPRAPAVAPPDGAAAASVDTAVRCSCASRSGCPVIGTLSIRGYKKEPVYCNQLNGSQNPGVVGQGAWYFQCVELANRWLVESVGAPRIDGNANEMCGNADRRAYDVHRRGSAYEPVPGDLLVWDGGAMGHVGVVTSVTASKIVFANQNYGGGGSQYPVLSVSRTASSFGAPRNGRLTAKCVIHAKALGRQARGAVASEGTFGSERAPSPAFLFFPAASASVAFL